MKKIFIILIIILLAFAGCSVLISKLQGMLPPQNTTFKTFEINLTNETFTTNLDTIILGRPSQPIKHPPLEDVRVECSDRVCSTSLCQVDYHESVSLKTIAKKTAQVCDNTYPKIMEKLSGNSPKSGRIPIIFKKEMKYAGYAHGPVVYINSKILYENPDMLGVIPHEITHVIQDYPISAPSWIQEGIADHTTFWLGYEYPWDYPHCGPLYEHYTKGYTCAAALLKYIEKKYDKNIVLNLNKLLRESKYRDTSFKTYTGKTLDELWQECKKTDCAYNDTISAYDTELLYTIKNDLPDEQITMDLELSLNESLKILENSELPGIDQQFLDNIREQILITIKNSENFNSTVNIT